VSAPVASSVYAGIAASVASLLVFLVVHHLWIKPIWFIALPGLLIAGLGGAGIGWAYSFIAHAMPDRPWSWLAMLALMLAVLLPGALLSLTHGPLFDLKTASIPPGEGGRVALRFALELVVPAMIVGAALGAWLGGSTKSALAMSLAALALALGPGHNVPMFGTNPAAVKGFVLLALSLLPVPVILVELARRGATP
jgi:hypothetical protein